MPEYETFNVRVVGDYLEMASGSFDPPMLVLPQGSTEFFSVDDGEIVTFDVEGEEVLGFEVWSLRAERVRQWGAMPSYRMCWCLHQPRRIH